MGAMTAEKPAVYQSLPVEKIRPSPHQARKNFDEDALRGLAESMKQNGLLEPILVRPQGTRFELISGERRLKAARLLGWAQIEAKLIQTADEADAAAKGLVENLQREDLNPIEEAEGFQTLHQLDARTWTQKSIGKIVGRSESFVSRSLDLLKLPEAIKANLRARKLSRSHGLELARLPNQKQQLKAARMIPGKLTWEETRALVDEMVKKPHADSSQLTALSKPLDPFENLWPSLIKEGKFPEGAWEVRYQRGGTWVFTVKTGGNNPADVLSDWFQFMGRSMPRTSPQKKDTGLGARAATKAEPVTMEDHLAQIRRTMPPDVAEVLAAQYAQIEAAAKTKKKK